MRLNILRKSIWAFSVPADCRLFVFVDNRENPCLLQFDNNNGACEEMVICSFADDFSFDNAVVFTAVLAEPCRMVNAMVLLPIPLITIWM